ncbi:MAG: Asp23/Gls24 family envelope stress response protein [Chloroflexota bacterium]
MSEQYESIGRIEVAPEVLVTIVRLAVQDVQGVMEMANPPSYILRQFQRGLRQEGVVLDLSENKVRFNIYVIMDPHVNLLEVSRAIQTAVTEAIDTMIGIPLDAVNVFVEDVHYTKDEVV